MADQLNVFVVQVTQEMIRNWGWFLAFGIALVLLGVAAVVRSVGASVASMLFFGWVLIVSGVIEFVTAFMVGKWAGFFLHLLVAVLLGITGAIFIGNPVVSAEAATLMMSVLFLLTGVFQLISALWSHLPGYGWHALNGIITTALGALLLAQWPVSGLYAVGLFVGIDLILFGWTWVVLALGLHRM